MAEGTLEEANLTLISVLESLLNISEVRSRLNSSKTAAVSTLSLIGPSVESAVQLARSINNTRLPDQLVTEIVRNASRGLRIAREALSETMEAR